MINNTSKNIKQSKTLLEEQNKIATILDNIPDLVWIKDPNGVYITCNKRFEELYGALKTDLIGKTDHEFVNKETADFFRKHDLQALSSTVPLTNFENLTFASDGHQEYTLTTKTKVFNEDGTILGVLGVGKDITELKNTEDTLKEQRVRYQSLMKFSLEAIFVVDTEGNLVESSNQFRKLLGYESEEELDLHVWDFEAIHTKEQILRNTSLVGYEPISFETKYRRKDGFLIDVIVSIVKISLHNQEFIYSSFKDITQSKLDQEKIFKQKEEFEAIFNTTKDGLAVIDLETNFLKVNKAYCDITGLSEEELLQTSCFTLTDPEYKERSYKILLEFIEKGKVDNFEKSVSYQRKTNNS